MIYTSICIENCAHMFKNRVTFKLSDSYLKHLDLNVFNVLGYSVYALLKKFIHIVKKFWKI